ncbi:hypothetical protein MTR67_033330 [Solanum verrucosum]|uniref:Uncharacterized protein n=1 Tax=Solanum verrucosum TaxID=315347 RepID=A0AAF0U640_SOLVR|nr:hypothetical protein MTR67_033330 [Solanum verrucosum]
MLEGDVSFLFDISKSEFIESLISLDLNHNRIFGSLSLPQGLKDVPLQSFNVSYNRLCGQIPQGGTLQSFDVYSYLHNKCLCGSPLPDWRGNDIEEVRVGAVAAVFDGHIGYSSASLMA